MPSSSYVVAAALAAALAVAFLGFSAAAPSEATTACPANITPAKPGAAASPSKGTYTTKYDNINVDMILHNERLLKNYIDCLMERKPCSREGQLLKGEFHLRIFRGPDLVG